MSETGQKPAVVWGGVVLLLECIDHIINLDNSPAASGVLSTKGFIPLPHGEFDSRVATSRHRTDTPVAGQATRRSPVTNLQCLSQQADETWGTALWAQDISIPRKRMAQSQLHGNGRLLTRRRSKCLRSHANQPHRTGVGITSVRLASPSTITYVPRNEM